jgi:glycosyltransferase involved in cell wall biosynthesis
MSTLLAINNYYYARGGAESVFLGHNRLLEERGWTVVPFAMQHRNNLPTPWAEYFIEEIELGSDYSLAQKLTRTPKTIYSFEARRKLARLLERVQPDVAHGHNIYHHLSPSILGVLKDRGIPTVLTLHDLKIACPAYTMLAPDGVCERCRGGRLYNVALHRCVHGSRALSLVVMVEAMVHSLLRTYERNVDCFIVPSRFYIDKFCEWGMPRTRFRHVPNCVDAARHTPNFNAGNGFLYFGRIARNKGLATLVQAAAQTGLPVAIAGTGPELATLRELAAQLRANVTFLGYLTGEALEQVIRTARAVVLPSEWYENAPMSILEAYALGKPVIGARIGGIPELVRESETGVCFSSGDVAGLAAAMSDVAARADAQISEMGRYGRAWVEREFGPATYIQRTLSVYRDLGVAIQAPGTVPVESTS